MGKGKVRTFAPAFENDGVFLERNGDKKGNEKIIVKILDFSLVVSIICYTFVTAFPLFGDGEFYE